MADVAKLVITVDTDAATAMRRLDDLDARIRRLSGQTIKIRVEADTAAASAQLDRIARDRTVNIHTDTNTLRRNVDDAMSSLTRLGRSGEDAGNAINRGAAAGSTGLGAMAKAGMIATGVILGIGPAAALVGGAILGGFPVAMGIAAGIILKDTKTVSDSLGNLKESVVASMAPMEKSVASVLDGFTTWFKTVGPTLTDFFTSTGHAMESLSDGVVLLVNNSLPGITQAMQAIKPVADGMNQGLYDLGTSIGSMFARLSQGSFGFGMALQSAFSQIGALLEILGGQFAKMANTGAQVLDGLLGGINGLVGGFLNGMVPALQAMAGPLSQFLQVLGDQLGGALRAIMPAVGNLIAALASALIPVLQALMPAIGPFIAALIDSLVPVIRALTPLLVLMAQGIAQILNWLRPMLPVLGPLAAAWWAVNAAMDANPAVLIIAGLAALTAIIVGLATKTQFFQTVWKDVWGFVKEVAQAVWNWLKDTWPQILGAIVGGVIGWALVKYWHDIWDGIKTAALAVWDFLKGAWQVVTGVFLALWNAAGQALKDAWKVIWDDNMKQVVLPIWDFLQSAWSAFITGLKTIWDSVSGALSSAWSATWNAIKSVAESIWSAIQAAWSAAITALRTIWDAVSGPLSTAWNNVWSNIKTVAQGIWDAIKAAWQTVTSAIKSIWDAISGPLSSAWSTVWNTIKTVAQGIWDAIKAAWQAVTSAIKAIWDAISGPLSSAWSATWNAIKTAGQAVWDFLKAAWQTFVNAVKSIWDAISGPLSAAWSTVWNGIKTAGQTIWDGLKTAWGTVVNAIKKIWDDISGPLKSAFEATWNAIKGVADSIWNGIKKTVGDAVNVVIDIINGIIGAWNTVVDAVGLKDLHVNTINHVGFATGGYVSGPGTATSDSIPARLSDGEFVMQASAVDKYGQGFMHAVNQGAFAGFASGGVVGSDGVSGFKGGGGVRPTPAQRKNPTEINPVKAIESIPVVGTVIKTAVDVGKWVLGEIGEAAIHLAFAPFDAALKAVGGPVGRMAAAGTEKVLNGLIDFLVKKDTAAKPAIGGTVPVGDHLAVIDAALKAAGVPPPGTQAEWETGLNTLITRESSWNAGAVNNTDSNAAAGTPSQGLAQVIAPTFAANHVPGTSDNILDPVANVAAAIRYIVRTYGNITNVQQANANLPPKGYWMGTDSAMRGWARIAEHGGEWMQSRGQWHYFSGGEKVLPHGVTPGGTGGGGHTVHVTFSDGSINISVPNGDAQEIAENFGDELASAIKMALIAGVGG